MLGVGLDEKENVDYLGVYVKDRSQHKTSEMWTCTCMPQVDDLGKVSLSSFGCMHVHCVVVGDI